MGRPSAGEPCLPHLLVSGAMSVPQNLLHRKASSGLLAAIGSVALGVTSIGCTSSEEVVETTVPTTIATTTSTGPAPTEAPTVPMFGDLPSPCGPATSAGVPTIAEGQNGSSPLKVGLTSDHGFEGTDSPGLEMLDAARAFAAWCNEQGGLRGLPIDIVDLDARITGVPLAMEQACADVFAMVGGGWTLDEQMYPRFHECGMVSFPAFTVSAAASLANGKVQAVPSPIDREATTWLHWVKETHSRAVDDIAIVHADLPTTGIVAARLATTMDVIGDFGDPTLIAFDHSGAADWTRVVQQMLDADVQAVAFIGVPSHLVALYAAMRTSGFSPEVVFGDVGLVSDVIADASASESFESLRVHSIHAPFSEADSSLGVSAYLEMMRTHAPTGRVGSLGLYTTSAMLLFATAANSCLDLDANVLERECILAEAKKISSWTAGGSHAPTDPGSDAPTSCMLVLGVESGSWIRVFPERTSTDTPDDTGNGSGADTEDLWSCNDDRIVALAGDFGDPTAGIDSSRLN
jgi:ABC-type branched-subunit amino acid transport system substrate-binding protein